MSPRAGDRALLGFLLLPVDPATTRGFLLQPEVREHLQALPRVWMTARWQHAGGWPGGVASAGTRPVPTPLSGLSSADLPRSRKTTEASHSLPQGRPQTRKTATEVHGVATSGSGREIRTANKPCPKAVRPWLASTPFPSNLGRDRSPKHSARLSDVCTERPEHSQDCSCVRAAARAGTVSARASPALLVTLLPAGSMFTGRSVPLADSSASFCSPPPGSPPCVYFYGKGATGRRSRELGAKAAEVRQSRLRAQS